MRIQPRLFGPPAETYRDTGLFDECQADEPTGLSCSACGRPMIRTESGYLCCTRGHGKLLEPVAFETPGGFWEELDDE